MRRFMKLWERQKKRVKLTDKDFRVALNLKPDQIAAFEGMGVTSIDVVGAVTQSVIAGTAVGAGAMAAATALGTAGTGVAISGLSGAAAHSALLAWFGGGSIAAGGGGMALGTLVLGGIFVAPIALVGALFAAKKGEEALTKAKDYAAQVDVIVEKTDLKLAALSGVERRAEEISSVTAQLDLRLLRQVKHCEDLERRLGGDKIDLKEFFKAASLWKALTDLLKVPVLDKDLEATAASVETISTARKALGEVTA